jgi:hypothetical protein
MADRTCKTCRWWDRRWEKAPTGYCDLLNFENVPTASGLEVLVTVADDHNLDWNIQTGPDFGCVHHVGREAGNDT